MERSTDDRALNTGRSLIPASNLMDDIYLGCDMFTVDLELKIMGADHALMSSNIKFDDDKLTRF